MWRTLLLLTLASGLHSALASSKKDEQVRLEQSVHVTRPRIKVESEQYGSFQAGPGVVADRVSYATGYALRVPAIVYHPSEPKRRRHPALVLATGPDLDKSSDQVVRTALAYSQAGTVVLTYDPPGEFERSHLRLSHSGQAKSPMRDEQMDSRLKGLMLEDLLQAARYLKTRKDVNRHKVGLIELGGGKTSANLACKVDSDLHACVLHLPPTAAAELGRRGDLKERLGISAPRSINDGEFPTRYQLHALPDSVWSESRDRYIFETWLEHAKTAIRSGAP